MPKRERVYTAASTASGNYSIFELAGRHLLIVSDGFRVQDLHPHQPCRSPPRRRLRQDISLEVGATTESITVEAQASLLQAETGDVTHNVTLEQMDNLPLLGIGTVNSGTSGYRNPYNTLLTLPGVSQLCHQRTVHGQWIGRIDPRQSLHGRTDGNDARGRPGRHVSHLRDLRLYADGSAERRRHSGNRLSDQQLRP